MSVKVKVWLQLSVKAEELREALGEKKHIFEIQHLKLSNNESFFFKTYGTLYVPFATINQWFIKKIFGANVNGTTNE